MLPLLGVFPVTLTLDLNDSESAKLSFGLSAYHLGNIAINFLVFFNNYHYIISNYTMALLYQYL